MKKLLFLFAFISVYSFGQMNTDRPSYSYSAQTLRKGEFQIEAGLQLNLREQNSPSTNYLQVPTAVFRIGLLDRVELRFQNGLNVRQVFSELEASMENLELGMKFNFVHSQKSNLSMIVQGIAPTSSGDWQPREKGGRLILAADHKIKGSGQLGYNVGSKFSSIADNDFSIESYYSVFYTHQMNSRLLIFGEVHQLFPSLEEFEVDYMELNLDFGFTYAVYKNLQLDYSFGFGLLNRMNFQALGLS